MPEALLLVAALFSCMLGLAWLALTLDAHWQQVRGSQPLPKTMVPVLRVLGAAALFMSLLLCFSVDHPSMAALVWIMSLAVAALVVTFTFTWRPRTFAPLVIWVPCT
jgi:hypothetical protein